MRPLANLAVPLPTLLAFCLAGSAPALTTTFTHSTAFLTALPGPPETLDFESQTAGTVIRSGTVENIT